VKLGYTVGRDPKTSVNRLDGAGPYAKTFAEEIVKPGAESSSALTQCARSYPTACQQQKGTTLANKGR
jgi:hypothetical protein